MDGERFVRKSPGTGFGGGAALRREFAITSRLYHLHGRDTGCVEAAAPSSNVLALYNPDDVSLTMPDELRTGELNFRRRGSHDLGDIARDLSFFEAMNIMQSLAIDLALLHQQGVVHRDIKPGNIMVDVGQNATTYAGLVDFGLSAWVGCLQSGQGCIGGTKYFSHDSQRDPSAPVHVGQDWFSFFRTALYLSRLTSSTRIQAEIEASTVLSLLIEPRHLPQALRPVWEVMNRGVELATGRLMPLEGLAALGMECVSMFESEVVQNALRLPRARPQQRGALARAQELNQLRPQHDVLLIFDSTQSIENDIQSVLEDFRSAMSYLDGRMDLRVDLWSVQDYLVGGEEGSAVTKLGYRLTPGNLLPVLSSLAAEAPQYETAEAYELALDYAGRHHWNPRQSAARSTMIIGDAYAHGWLRRNWWFELFRDQDDEFVAYRRDWQRRHPKYDRQFTAMKNAWTQAAQHAEEVDHKGAQHQHVVDGGKKKFRPNLLNVIKRLRERKNSRLYTLHLGDDLCSRSYMYFTALVGRGSCIEAGRSPGIIAAVIAGVLASEDPEAYAALMAHGLMGGGARDAMKPVTDDKTLGL